MPKDEASQLRFRAIELLRESRKLLEEAGVLLREDRIDKASELRKLAVAKHLESTRLMDEAERVDKHSTRPPS